MTDIMKDKPEHITSKEWVHNMYRVMREIAESTDGVCRHVNAARTVLHLPPWTENMIDPVPCKHHFVESRRETVKRTWFTLKTTEDMDFLYCTHCGMTIDIGANYVSQPTN